MLIDPEAVREARALGRQQAAPTLVREREPDRQRREREADPCYWRARWCSMFRAEGLSVAEIAAADQRDDAEVRAGIDATLQAQLGMTLEQFEAERQAARERARAAWRRARLGGVQHRGTS